MTEIWYSDLIDKKIKSFNGLTVIRHICGAYRGFDTMS